MDFEDSRNAIFCDPNAFIQGFEKKQIKKVVFAEPYDCLPSFYIDNDFKKHHCDCVPKPKPPKQPKPSPCTPFSFNFDFKNMLPILMGLLSKNGNTDLTKMLSGLTSSNFANATSGENGNGASSGFDFQQLVSGVMQNPKMLESVMSIFKFGGLKNLFKSKSKSTLQETDKQAKQTDHIIKNYTRVET
mgnify:CR=1 FL=1